MDGGLYGLGAAASVFAGSTTSYLAGLLARGRSPGRAGQTVGAGDHGSGEAGIPADAGSDQGFTGVARHRGDFGGDDRIRVGPGLPVRERAAVDGYSGAVPSEDSSGKRKQRGSITKTGNAHLRRIVVEAAWSYSHRPATGPRLRKRQEGVPEPIKEIAWKAQHRLHKRYLRLAAAGKEQRKIITAVGRKLLGFIWAIAVRPNWQASNR